MPDLRRSRLARATAVCSVLAAVSLAGCGQDGADDDTAPDPAAASTASDEPTTTPTATPTDEPSDEPSSKPTRKPAAEPSQEQPAAGATPCGTVWVTGRTIPRTYQGCAEAGSFVESDVLGCSSGQRFVTFGDRYYGVLGGTVREGGTPLAQDRTYRASVASCRG